MRRRVSLYLVAVLGVADIVALYAAFHLTGALRIALNALLERPFTAELVRALFPPLPWVIGCWLATLAWRGAYDLLGSRGLGRLALTTARAVTLAMGLTVVLLFFATRQVYSRSLFLLFWAVSLVLLVGARQLALLLLRRLKPLGYGSDPVAIVGTGPVARLLGRKLDDQVEPRFRLVGYLADRASTAGERAELGSRVLADADGLETVINRHGLERIFLANPRLPVEDALALLETCQRMEVGVDRVPDFLGLVGSRATLGELDGLPLLSLRPVGFSRWQELVKRSVDVVAASLLLLVLAPLLALLALGIRLDSPGPVLFRQRRVGKGGKHFWLIKLRSMQADAAERRAELQAENQAAGHIFKLERDPRVTRIGRVLRRLSLDELPQLWNVLQGDMSLVGPRPLPSEDLEVPDSPHAFWMARRRTVRPGITGLWQVSGRSGLGFEEMVNLDLLYINQWSLGLDLVVLLRTLPAVLRGRGAW